MRNLKRALSLALASVMLVGMMVVGASAASYPDVDSNDNVEAISVLQAVGVMQGDGDTGEFRPDSEVSRNEMAVIMARLLLGPDADSYVGTHPFTDVPAWADKYVAACYNDGIIMGMDDTTYGGTSTITAEQAAAMMMRALGYEKLEGTGADWAKNVVAKANSISLFKNLGGNVKAELTRDQIAQLGLNTLKATVVDSDVEQDIIIEGVATIPGKVTYTERKVDGETSTQNYTDIGATPAGLGTLQLCEKLYGTDAKALKLKAAASGDDFGRPATEWSYKNDSVAKVAEEPIASFTAKTSEDDVLKAIKGYEFGGNKIVDKTSEAGGDVPVDSDVDGIATSTGPVVPDIAALTADGKLVEIFATDNDVTKVVTVTYSVDKVKSITEKNGKTTYKFDNASSKSNDEDNTDVILEGDIAEGDVVTIASVSGKYYVYPTTSFTGNQTAIRAKDGTYTATIGGEKYVIGVGVTRVDTPDSSHWTNSKDDATYYVDVNGFVVKVEDLEKTADEYAVITKVATESSKVTLDDPSGYTVNVRAVLADGTVADYKLDTAQNGSTGPFPAGSDAHDLICGDVVVYAHSDADLSDGLQDAAVASLVDNLFAYSINDDDEMVLSAVTAADTSMTEDEKYGVALAGYNGENNKAGATSQSGVTALFTKDTVFVVWNIDGDGKVTAEAPKTGTADLSVSGAGGKAVIEASGAAIGSAKVVFLKTDSVAKEEDYVYIDASAYTTELDPDDNKKQIKVWDGIAADGSEVKVHVASTTNTAGLKDGLYVYDTDYKLKTSDPKAVIDNADTTISNSDLYAAIIDRAVVSKDLLQIGAAYVNITSDTQIVYIKDDLSEVNGNKCLVVMESNGNNTPENVAAIFVFDEGDPDTGDAAVTLNNSTAALTEGNTEEASLTATFNAGSTELTASSYAWTSSDTGVATVSGSNTTGTVTFVADGSATITCTATLSNGGKVTATCTVTCTGAKGATVTLTESSGTLTADFKAGGSGLTASTYEYSSSDTSVATVTGSTESGTVSKAGNGTATITVIVTLSNGAKITDTVDVTFSD